MIVRYGTWTAVDEDPYHTLIEFSFSADIQGSVLADRPRRYFLVHSMEPSLAGFVNSTGKFNLIVVKPVLYFVYNGVPLNSKRKLGNSLVQQYGPFQLGFNHS